MFFSRPQFQTMFFPVFDKFFVKDCMELDDQNQKLIHSKVAIDPIVTHETVFKSQSLTWQSVWIVVFLNSLLKMEIT